MTFGEKLKYIRTEKGKSQEEMATLFGTSKQVISRYETNQRVPKITIVKEYADKLNVPLNYLLDNDVSSLENAVKAPRDDEERTPLNMSDIQYALFHETEDVSDETMESILAFARFAIQDAERKKKEKESNKED